MLAETLEMKPWELFSVIYMKELALNSGSLPRRDLKSGDITDHSSGSYIIPIFFSFLPQPDNILKPHSRNLALTQTLQCFAIV